MTEWTDHCRNFAKEHGCTYKEAMTRAKSSYTPKTGGKMKIKNVVRKARNSTKRATRIIDKVEKYTPLLEMVAPETVPVIESIKSANNVVKTVNGAGKKKKKANNPYILNGGSFKLHGSGLGFTQSSMISPQHPSFNPNPPKSIKKRQTDN